MMPILPQWAKEALNEYGPNDITNVIHDTDILQICHGIVVFNGELAFKQGIPYSTWKQETINFVKLPFWAMKAILKTGKGTRQVIEGKNILQIAKHKAVFNKKSVEKDWLWRLGELFS